MIPIAVLWGGFSYTHLFRTMLHGYNESIVLIFIVIFIEINVIAAVIFIIIFAMFIVESAVLTVTVIIKCLIDIRLNKELLMFFLSAFALES